MIHREVESRYAQVTKGYDPYVLTQRNDLAFVWALKQSQCKAMITHADGSYEEAMLPVDHGISASVAATYCYMNLEASVPQLKDWMTPTQLRDRKTHV